MEESRKTYWDKVREFNLSRTPFWMSCLVQLFLTIIPFVAIWILVGPDFKHQSFNYYQSLSHPQAGYLLIIVFAYLVHTSFLAAITWLFHWQKADVFTYTFGLSLAFISIILNGIWMVDWNTTAVVQILIRFIIAITSGLIGVVLGVVVTTFARNSDYKMEEKNYELVMAYRDEDTIDPSVVMEQTSTLDEKLVAKYDEHQAKLKWQREQRKLRMDAKEAKKRERDQKK